MKKISRLLKLLVSLFLLIFFFFYAITFNNAIGWDLLFLSILIMVVTSVSLLSPLKAIKVSEQKALWVQVGETRKVRFELRNSAFFFPILVVKCAVLNLNESFPLFIKKRQVIESLWTPEKRGFIKELTFELKSDDFFGLFNKCRIKKVPSEIYVLPQPFYQFRDLLNLFDPTLKRLILGESTFELEKIREYQPGDAIKSIDWKLSSKKQQLIYREYENHEKNKMLFIFYGTKSDYFEGMLRVFFSFYQWDQESKHRFVLIGEGIEQKNNVDLVDFCRIKNNESVVGFPHFTEKHVIFFVPERTVDFENYLSEIPANKIKQVIDYQTLKGRLML